MKEFLTGSVFFGAVISLLGYEAGLLLKKKFRLAVFNPLLIAVICVMAVLLIFDVDYDSYNEGGKYLSYLLTPATVCLAVPLYEQLSLLRKNFKAVAAGILSGTLASMFVSEELGGIVTITVAVIVITGVLGAILAELVFKIFRIQEPVARGLALGTSAHAIGTSKAMEFGMVEGAMSSLAIAVAGLLTVVGASFFAELI